MQNRIPKNIPAQLQKERTIIFKQMASYFYESNIFWSDFNITSLVGEQMVLREWHNYFNKSTRHYTIMCPLVMMSCAVFMIP